MTTIGVAVLAAATLIVVYHRFNPTGSGWVLRCPFKLLTSLDCPSCGNQRAFHALLHGQVGAAFRYNPFLFVSLPYIIPLCMAYLFKDSWQNTWRRLSSRGAVMTYVVLYVAWFVVRNTLL